MFVKIKKLFILYILLISLNISLAQTEKIFLIEQRCDSINSLISSEEEAPFSFLIYRIELKSIKRAIGEQNTFVSFYLFPPKDSVIEKKRSTKFIYVYSPPFKINVKYNIAASQFYSIDYYFNPDGKLIFYHLETKGADFCGFEKWCFMNDSLLKIDIAPVENCTDAEGNPIKEFTSEAFNPYSADTNFTKKDYSKSKKIIAKAKKYITMYKRLTKIEELEK